MSPDSVIDGDGRRTWRGKCLSRPESIAEVLRQHAPDAVKIGMETGPLSIWLWHGLRALDVPVDCIHATDDDAPIATRMAVEAAMAIIDLIRAGETERLRICAGDDCGDVVIDLSKNRSRRYCDGTCANKAHVAAYRARRQAP